MELVFAALLLLILAVSIAGAKRDAKVAKVLQELREIQRFLVYVEKRQDALPADVVARLDDLKAYLRERDQQ